MATNFTSLYPSPHTHVFPYPSMHVTQTPEVIPQPVPESTPSQSKIPWPVIVGVTVAALLALVALLCLVYFRAHQRLRTIKTTPDNAPSGTRTTKWANPSKWGHSGKTPTLDLTPSGSTEPGLHVQKWLEALTPHRDRATDDAATSDAAAAPTPLSDDTCPASLAVPVAALLACRTDDKPKKSSQMHHNPIYDIRPPGNDNPMFSVDPHGGSRSAAQASGSSAEHLLISRISVPQHTPCSSPGASMALPQAVARRLGASSGADRGPGETLELDARRSNRSKSLWPLDSATRMPVKDAGEDTASLSLGQVCSSSAAAGLDARDGTCFAEFAPQPLPATFSAAVSAPLHCVGCRLPVCCGRPRSCAPVRCWNPDGAARAAGVRAATVPWAAVPCRAGTSAGWRVGHEAAPCWWRYMHSFGGPRPPDAGSLASHAAACPRIDETANLSWHALRTSKVQRARMCANRERRV